MAVCGAVSFGWSGRPTGSFCGGGVDVDVSSRVASVAAARSGSNPTSSLVRFLSSSFGSSTWVVARSLLFAAAYRAGEHDQGQKADDDNVEGAR